MFYVEKDASTLEAVINVDADDENGESPMNHITSKHVWISEHVHRLHRYVGGQVLQVESILPCLHVQKNQQLFRYLLCACHSLVTFPQRHYVWVRVRVLVQKQRVNGNIEHAIHL